MTALLLFPSIHHVLRAEKVLIAGGVAGTLIPVPHDVSTECGMAWSMAEEKIDEALAALGAAGLRPDAAWASDGSGWAPLSLDRG